MGAPTRTAILLAVALLATFLAIPTLDGSIESEQAEDRASASIAASGGSDGASGASHGEGPVPGSVDVDRGRASMASDALPGEPAVRDPRDPLSERATGRDARRDLGTERGPGTFLIVPGVAQTVGTGPVRTFSVEVETHLAEHAEWFARSVDRILSDPRGWTARGSVALRRVDHAGADVRVTLASPETVDELCAPLETNGRFSCWNGGRAIINAWRWEHGAASYGEDLDAYRSYLVSHEVGHGLGHGHVGCPAPGTLAPVMMQQTIGVEGCAPNPWPYPDAAD